MSFIKHIPHYSISSYNVARCSFKFTAYHYLVECLLSLPLTGSVFVDVVCAQLQESQGHNISEVLEAVCRIIHQIVFRSEENKFVGESKQACYYESTFQKTYIVPRM